MAETKSSGSVAICPNCMAKNPPESHFCRACTAPLSSLAAIDPIWHIWAEGFLYRKAVHGAKRRIVLFGMWILFGPACLLLLMKFVNACGDLLNALGRPGDRGSLLATAVLIAFLIGGVALNAAILGFTTRNYLRNRENQAPSPSQK